MQQFTLRTFELFETNKDGALQLLGKATYAAETASEGKLWLTNLMAEGRLATGTFYRFEANASFPDVHLQTTFNLSFCLFSGTRICPVRIRHRSEKAHWHSVDPEWSVDFEGVPTWSLMRSIEPRWQLLQSVPQSYGWMGRSRRDWQRRDCWTIPQAISCPVHSAA